MGCFVALIALLSPRLALFLLWIFGDLLSRAFSSWILPLLGFFLLPWTTLVYVALWDWAPGHHLAWRWIFVVFAFLVDISSDAGGKRAQAARG